MPVPRTQVITLVVACVMSVALTAGAMVLLGGPKSAQASTTTPQPSVATGTSVTVKALPGHGVTPAPRSTVAASAKRETLPLGPLDSATIAAGFRSGGYRFTVRTAGFPSFSAAAPLETGVVQEARHFVLEWPKGSFISRYVRDGDSRTAWIGDNVLVLAAGDGWERTPDEMLPADFYAAEIAPWTGALTEGSSDGEYVANADLLRTLAETIGVSPTDWTLSVRVDASGRLVAARFAGLVGRHPFLLDLAMTYDNPGAPVAGVSPGAASSSAMGPSVASRPGGRGR